MCVCAYIAACIHVCAQIFKHVGHECHVSTLSTASDSCSELVTHDFAICMCYMSLCLTDACLRVTKACLMFAMDFLHVFMC